MMAIEAFGDSEAMARAAERLDHTDGVRSVRRVEATRAGNSVLSAVAHPRVVKTVLGDLSSLGIPAENMTVTRLDVVQWTVADPGETSAAWADILGEAWLVAKPLPRYLAFMLVAGVIACYGVLDRNVILIVGAMAVSPDLLPVMATGVGIFGRRWSLAAEAAGTFLLGMTIACLAAAAFAFVLDQLGGLPGGFTLDSASAALGGLTNVSNETIAVALGAGVAGMLALETNASSAVGVAVSVTTIPAAAFLGVAAGMGDLGTALGALGVLGMNFAMMTLGACLALLIQRR